MLQYSIHCNHVRVLMNLLDLVARIPDIHKLPNQWEIYQKLDHNERFGAGPRRLLCRTYLNYLLMYAYVFRLVGTM